MPRPQGAHAAHNHVFQSPRGRGAKYPGLVDVSKYRDAFSGPPCRTLADMTEAEIVALEAHYGCPVIRPDRKVRRRATTRAS